MAELKFGQRQALSGTSRHLVLAHDTRDFTAGEFDMTFTLSEDIAMGALSIQHDIILTEEPSPTASPTWILFDFGSFSTRDPEIEVFSKQGVN